MFYRILVVCVGNICRSPIAQSLLSQTLHRAGRRAVVRSAGLNALSGRPPHHVAQRIVREKTGWDISRHRARQLDSSLIRWADLILVMEQRHKRTILDWEPSARGKVYRIGEWRNLEVPDPVGRSEPEFEETFRLLNDGVLDWTCSLVDKAAN